MKAVLTLCTTFGILVLAVTLVSANPATLPDHPGYPAAGKDPVTGMSLANDTGETHAIGQEALAKSAEFGREGAENVAQDPKTQDQNNQNLERRGAGQLPVVDSVITEKTSGINPGGTTSIKLE